jgi:hypothetical protein
MSRPFFMPLLAPEAPGRRLGRPAGKSRLRATGWLRSRVATRQAGARAPIPYLGVTTSLEGCRGSGLADAVLHRVLRSGAPVGTVVLDLGAAATLDPETCAAILLMHQRLTAIGTRLRLAASARGLIDCLADAGVVQQLGRDTIHMSFRGAVLAVYAAQPGPGLAVGRIRTELETQAETIELLVPGPGRPRSGASPIRSVPGPGRTGAIGGGPRLLLLHPLRVGPSPAYSGELGQL